MRKDAIKLFEGFSKLNLSDRLSRLVEAGALTYNEVYSLSNVGEMKSELAEKFIENVIGYFPIPLGVVTNLRIDEKDYVIPMAVEETSIIAAASKTAKWIRGLGGTISTQIQGKESIGQIQIAKVKDFNRLSKVITEQKQYFISIANREAVGGLILRGGGVKNITLRQIPRSDGCIMAIIHVLVDTCEAMGANSINQVCEFLKKPIEEASGETVTMCILSNLVDTKLTKAFIEIPLDAELGEKIEEASLFAQLDPYRAATNNKGVINGMDPILIATGNDWRAVGAGVHAYAARSGQYRSITQWTYKNGNIHGTFEAPVIVGIVGGVTTLHPTAKIAINMMKIKSSNHLSSVIAAVGLVQNLGALRALTTVGIIEGHMKLHIANLTLGAGAEGKEIPLLQKRLEHLLSKKKRITLTNAIEVLAELRKQKPQTLENNYQESTI